MNIKVSTAGESLIDLVLQKDGLFEPCLGGAVYNLSRALSRQDVKTLYLNPFSQDRFGRQLRQQMQSDGVVLGSPLAVSQATSLAVVALSEQGHPDYAFYREEVADRVVSAASLIEICAQHPSLEVVCTGALALAAEDSQRYLPWLEVQRQLGKLVVVDANLRPSVMRDLPAYRANVRQAIALADVVKLSDEDLQHLQLPALDPAQALQSALQLLANLPHTVLLALTLGEHGAYLLQRNQQGSIQIVGGKQASPVQVVDTVGAGDCFLAGLLASALAQANQADSTQPGLAPLLNHASAAQMQTLLQHALASATYCVMQRGCTPPTWQQARQLAQTLPMKKLPT